MLAIDIVAAGLALSAARRYVDFAAECNARLPVAFASSVRLPLSTPGPCPPRGSVHDNPLMLPKAFSVCIRVGVVSR